jgi:hypothetical protein
MPYDLTKPEERARLLVALLHDGGSEDDRCALADAVEAGYTLAPPQSASVPFALPDDTVTVRLEWHHGVLYRGGDIRGHVSDHGDRWWFQAKGGDPCGWRPTEPEARAALMAAARKALGG